MATHYIDHSAANNGDGTDAAQAASGGAVGAFNGLIANLGSIAAGDTVWIRRSGTAEALSAVFTLWDGGGCYGWPKSTDPTYATRPAAGTSAGWDADSDDYAEFTTASTTDILVRPTSAVAVMVVRRIHMLTSSTSSSQKCVHLATNSQNTSFAYCKFENSAGSNGMCFHIEESSNNTIDNCVFLRSSVTATGTSWYGLIFLRGFVTSAAQFNMFSNCSFDAGPIGDCSGSTGAAVFIGMSYDYTYSKNNTIFNCTFSGAATKDQSGYGQGSDPWLSLRGSNLKLLDCTIEDTETVTDYTKQSLYLDGYDCKVERLKLIRGGRIRDNTQSKRNSIGIYESSFVSGVSNPVSIISLAGANARFTARGATFSATTDSVYVSGADGDVLLVGCTYVGAVSTVTGARSYVTQLGSGVLVGIWNKFAAGGLLTADAGVIRTSGVSAWSIRHLPPAGAVSGGTPMSIGSPENPTIYVNVASSGTKTFTLYAAYKNFSAATPDGVSFWFEIYYLNANNNLKLASSRGAALVADGSTWTGDTGLTVVRQSLAVTIPTAQVVSAVIYGSLPFESAAYGFIDPLIVVT